MVRSLDGDRKMLIRTVHEYANGYDIFLWPVVNIYRDGDYKAFTLRFWKWSWTWSND